MVSALRKSSAADSSSVNLSLADGAESHESTIVPSLLICGKTVSTGAGMISIEQFMKFPHSGSCTPLIFGDGGAVGWQSLRLVSIDAASESQSRKCHQSGLIGGEDAAGDGKGSVSIDFHPRWTASGTQIRVASSRAKAA